MNELMAYPDFAKTLAVINLISFVVGAIIGGIIASHLGKGDPDEQ